jgi:BirA family biotin operon repressor/biotin-[acetyl-CoA-carboxylase] ligase
MQEPDSSSDWVSLWNEALSDWPKPVVILDEIGSTNQYLLDLVGPTGDRLEEEEGGGSGYCERVCVARHQTAGRGRLGRSWNAPAGLGLLASLLFRKQDLEAAPLLPVAVATATAQAVELLYPRVEPQLKWPNDVLVGDGKLAGILVEQRGDWLVAGFGINILQKAEDFPPDTMTPPVSLAMALKTRGSHVAPDAASGPALLRSIVEKLEELLLAPGSPDRILQAYRRRLVTLGQCVSIQTGNQGVVVEGVAIGVDRDGSLMVRLDHGPTVAVYSGDASLRPMAEKSSFIPGVT